MKEALLYEKSAEGLVRCFLCAHFCRIEENKFGFCGVRQNIEGRLFTHSYGKVVASQIDPIEKKPLYHFFPGSSSFSIAAAGCNFRCGFCQNWQISQAPRMGMVLKEVPAKDIVEAACRNKCQSVSYTYTEPTIFFEYALDIAKLAKDRGLGNCFITNGYMSREALKEIRPFLDAANVDLKFFNEGSYNKICRASLKPVLETIRLMKDLGLWVEVTTLIIPQENDSEKELSEIAGFIASVDKNMPWHISRFHPDYEFSSHKVTPESALIAAEKTGRQAGLNFIYIGNAPGFDDNTYCHQCKKLLIKRECFNILLNDVKAGKCPHCAADLPGRF